MVLRFLARRDGHVRYPGPSYQGQVDRHIAQTFDSALLVSHPDTAGYRIDDTPFECPSDSDLGRRLVTLVRREASLIPADSPTATACGTEFVEHEFVDGVVGFKPKASTTTS